MGLYMECRSHVLQVRGSQAQVPQPLGRSMALMKSRKTRPGIERSTGALLGKLSPSRHREKGSSLWGRRAVPVEGASDHSHPIGRRADASAAETRTTCRIPVDLELRFMDTTNSKTTNCSNIPKTTTRTTKTKEFVIVLLFLSRSLGPKHPGAERRARAESGGCPRV